GLVPLPAGVIKRITRLEWLVAGGNQRHGPVLVGEAEPAIGGLPGRDRAFLGKIVIVDFLESFLAGNADQALVQDEETTGLRRAIAGGAAIGGKRYRLFRFIGDTVLDGEHVIGIDRNPARKGQAAIIGVAEGNRCFGRKRRIAVHLPDRVAA